MKQKIKKIIALACAVVLSINMFPVGGMLSKADAGYTSYTLNDLGIANGLYESGQVKGRFPTALTSLDKVEVIADMAFAESNSCLRIGGMDTDGYMTPLNIFNSGGMLWSWDELQNVDHVAIGNVETNKKVKITLRFDYIGSDVKVAFYLNDTFAVEHTYAGYAEKFSANILLWARSGALAVGQNVEQPKEEVIEQKTPAELGYQTQVRPVDFSLKDGTYAPQTATGSHRWGKCKKNTLTGTYLDVNLSFADADTILRENSLRYASEDGWSGIQIGVETNQLVVQDARTAKGNVYALEKLPISRFTKTFNLKLGLKIGSRDDAGNCDVTYDLWINDVRVAAEAKITGVGGTGTGMGIYTPSGSITIASPDSISDVSGEIEQKSPQALGYTQVRPADFELSDGTYSPQHKYGNHHFGQSKKKSLSKTYLDVNVRFKDTDKILRENSIRFASPDGWTGIQIGIEADQLFIIDALTGQGNAYMASELGLTTLNRSFNLKLGVKLGKADKDGKQDVTYDLWINDIRVAAEVLIEKVGGLGNGMSIYTPSGTVIVKSTLSVYGDETGKKKEKLPTGFRKVTFATFDIKNGTYKHIKSGMTAYGESVLSLDQTMFSGDFYFFNEKGGDFRYGGMSNEWCGLWFHSMPDGKIYMQGVEGNTGTYVFKPFVAGTDLTDKRFNLKLTTQIVDSDRDGKKDDVKLGVWFNGVLYDNAYIYLTDYAQYFGNYAGLYVDEGNGYVKVWNDLSVDTSIDYTLFGYTKENWRNKIGL